MASLIKVSCFVPSNFCCCTFSCKFNTRNSDICPIVYLEGLGALLFTRIHMESSGGHNFQDKCKFSVLNEVRIVTLNLVRWFEFPQFIISSYCSLKVKYVFLGFFHEVFWVPTSHIHCTGPQFSQSFSKSKYEGNGIIPEQVKRT